MQRAFIELLLSQTATALKFESKGAAQVFKRRKD